MSFTSSSNTSASPVPPPGADYSPFDDLSPELEKELAESYARAVETAKSRYAVGYLRSYARMYFPVTGAERNGELRNLFESRWPRVYDLILTGQTNISFLPMTVGQLNEWETQLADEEKEDAVRDFARGFLG